jgi:H+/Cl- antiporter ClcA
MEESVELFGCFIPETLFFPMLIIGLIIGLMFIAFLAKVVKTSREVTYDPYSR